MIHGKFGTIINCIDGRAQAAAVDYLKNKYGLDWVDNVTEAGPDKILAENKELDIISNIKERVGISIEKHCSVIIAIAAHDECAGNPVDKNSHIEHLRSAIKTVKNFGFNVQVIALWIPADWKTAEEVN